MAGARAGPPAVVCPALLQRRLPSGLAWPPPLRSRSTEGQPVVQRTRLPVGLAWPPLLRDSTIIGDGARPPGCGAPPPQSRGRRRPAAVVRRGQLETTEAGTTPRHPAAQQQSSQPQSRQQAPPAHLKALEVVDKQVRQVGQALGVGRLVAPAVDGQQHLGRHAAHRLGHLRGAHITQGST